MKKEKFSYRGLLQTTKQMVMLQLEDILLLVIVVQLKAALLRGQTCLGRLLFTHEGRPARRFRDPDPCQSCFLQKNKKERANVRENKIVLSKNRFDLRHLSAATSFVKEKKLEIGEGKCLDAAKIRSTNNGHLHGQPSFSNRVLERDQIIQGGEERAERLSDLSLCTFRTTVEGSSVEKRRGIRVSFQQ